MAVTAKVVTEIKTWRDDCHIITWADIAVGNTGDPLEMPGSADRSVQVDGTFSGSTCVIEGSNDGVTYYTLTDPQGNALSFTAARIESITEVTRYIRPSVSAGTGVIDVTMLVRRPFK